MSIDVNRVFFKDGAMAQRDSVLKLNDKTVAVVGSFGSMTQMILTFLSEQGADVALVGRESAEARRVVENLNDQREIYSHYGRATHVISSLAGEREANDAVLRVVESFGRLDALVDTTVMELNSTVIASALADSAGKFVMSRPRGRIVFACYPHLTDLIKPLLMHWSREIRAKQGQCNALQIGLSEEYLLKSYPKAVSIKAALEEHRRKEPEIRLVEPMEIAQWVTFLCSSLSQGLNGQVVPLG